MSTMESFMRSPRFWIIVLLLILAPLLATAEKTPGDPFRIAVLGDSLVAGYGLLAEEAFPAQLEIALRKAGHKVVVQNAGVSGDTTAGGLARLEWTLAGEPDLVIVELGANDALRGLDPQLIYDNLDSILTRLQARGVKVLLAGIYAPRNLGQGYYNKFDSIYPVLAKKHQIPLYPFFLEGVATKPELNLEDGMHPNAAGVAVMVRGMLPKVLETMDRPGS